MSSKLKLYISRCDIPTSVVDKLKEKYDVDFWNEKCRVPRDILLEKIKGKDGLFILHGDIVDKEFLDAAGSQLKVISTMSVGYDHIDVEEVKRRNIRLGYAAGVLDDAVAELAIAVLLATTRRLFEGHRAILDNEWKKWSPWNWMNGVGLKDSTVGIFGLGRIGFEIAKRIVPFKVGQILYTSRNEKSYAEEVNAKRVDFDVLLKECDIIFIVCSLNDETNQIFGYNEFKKMKKTSVLINISRGGVINQDDLIRALKEGEIGSAGLDVMTPEPLPSDHELLHLNNCVVVPHLGSAVWATRLAMSELTAENIICGLNGLAMPAEII